MAANFETDTPGVGRLESIQVGAVRTFEMPEQSIIDGIPAIWTSGIFKSTVTGQVLVSAQGIMGDQQADLDNHGGPDNVVLAYDISHYPVWREKFRNQQLPYGAFGENFDVSGFSDDNVCIGDVWRVGADLTLQVTQARQPCFKLARRLAQPEIVQIVRETSWGGWYLRVLKEGITAAGDPIRLLERHHPDWPVARAVQVMYARRRELGPARELFELPELSRRWREHLLEVLQP